MRFVCFCVLRFDACNYNYMIDGNAKRNCEGGF